MPANNNIPGLTPATQEVFEQVSQLDCIKDLFLCGGTGQSLQMDHRLSEDLDFELLRLKKDGLGLDFGAIIGEIKSVFPDAREEILGEDLHQSGKGEAVVLSASEPGEDDESGLAA